jgi:hypothetical protein
MVIFSSMSLVVTVEMSLSASQKLRSYGMDFIVAS